MEEFLNRFVGDLIDRVSGPMSFRLILQPLVAAVFAVIAGLKDLKYGKPPYFLQLFAAGSDRSKVLKDGWSSVGRIFIFAVVLDVIYQWIVQHWVYPGEVLFTAILLAIVPYVIIRGLTRRIAAMTRLNTK